MTRLAAAARQVWDYVRRAPGTFIWLAILLVTTIFLLRLPTTVAAHVLGSRSTNLHHLAEDPVRVLFSSAFWIADGEDWIFYLAIYNVIHVPAERWLGTLRWLAVVVIAHIGATYISEGILSWAIDHGYAAMHKEFVLDVGVSYGLAGVAGILFFHLAKPWRYYYLAGLFLLVTIPLIVIPSFTAIGHFAAVLIGLACWPLTCGRRAVWDPAPALRRLRPRARTG